MAEMTEARKAQMQARIYNLSDFGANICAEFQHDDTRMISCGKCGYTSDVHDIRDALAAIERLEGENKAIKDDRNAIAGDYNTRINELLTRAETAEAQLAAREQAHRDTQRLYESEMERRVAAQESIVNHWEPMVAARDAEVARLKGDVAHWKTQAADHYLEYHNAQAKVARLTEERDAERNRVDIVISEFDQPWPHGHKVGDFAALHARLVNQGWQPIETAPKDELVLLWRPRCGEAIAIRRVDDWCGLECCPDAEPTHWQPLPTPPAPSEAQ